MAIYINYVLGAILRPPFLLLSSDDNSAFSLDSSTGELRTLRRLNGSSSYRLLVLSDGGTTSVDLEVQVTGDDDDVPPPSFEGRSVRVDIPENTPVGARRKLPAAMDDLRGRGKVEYRIVEGNKDGVFGLGR